tara:strand:+ start:292 stop:528 length:237 start_codon:yes stop_codon:yes gene_type:complete
MEPEEGALLLGGLAVAGMLYLRVRRERAELAEAEDYGALALTNPGFEWAETKPVWPFVGAVVVASVAILALHDMDSTG